MKNMTRIILERLPEREKETFFAMFVFSMMIGNSDNHAGNYSLLHDIKSFWRFAPAYDLVSVTALKKLDEDGLFGPKSMVNYPGLKAGACKSSC